MKKSVAQIGGSSLEFRNLEQKSISKVIPDYFAYFGDVNEDLNATTHKI